MNNKRKKLCWKIQKGIKQRMHKYNNTALIKKYLAKENAYIKTSSSFKKQYNLILYNQPVFIDMNHVPGSMLTVEETKLKKNTALRELQSNERQV